jgi:hypothetical protein
MAHKIMFSWVLASGQADILIYSFMLKPIDSPAAAQNLQSYLAENSAQYKGVNKLTPCVSQGVKSDATGKSTVTDGKTHRRGKEPPVGNEYPYPFPIAFIQFTKELRSMREWFESYGRKQPKEREYPANCIQNLQYHIQFVATEIGGLAGYEFEKCFFSQSNTEKP